MIDLHTHSTASDGTTTPRELVRAAASAGITTLALTDHDTTAGWSDAAQAARMFGVRLVRGIEVSCQREGASLHLLGYLPDPDGELLSAELAKARDSRELRLERMVELLAADGIPITVAEVYAQVGEHATFGRPHLADALVVAGIVPDRATAFNEYLHDESPYYVAHYASDPLVAVQAVLEAGGVPVLAHPFIGRRGVAMREEWVEELAAAGLVGIETEHPEQGAEGTRRAQDLARALGLLVTGSSDFHGKGKINRLGERTTSPSVLDAIVARARGVEVIRP